jgi:hypothetical protein
VVRGQHEHDRTIALASLDFMRCQRDGRSGVPPERLEEKMRCNTFYRIAQILEFVARLKVVFAVCYLSGRRSHRVGLRAQECLLQQALPIGESHERFGYGFARYRP